jgi:hypothetical protein
MAITYNTGTTTSGSGTSINVTIPAGVLVNDVVFFNVYAECNSSFSVSTSSTGTALTQLPSSPQGQKPSGSENQLEAVYYIVAGVSDPGATVTFSTSFSSTWVISLASYTGANTSSTIDVNGGTNVYGVGTTGITFPAETTDAVGDWAIYLGCDATSSGFDATSPSGTNLREPTSLPLTTPVAAIWDSGGGVGPSGSSIGGGVLKSNNSGNEFFGAFSVGLEPAAGINVIQSVGIVEAYSGNFNYDVTAGNTIFIVVGTYNTSAVTISSSSPTFNGNPVSGVTELLSVQSGFDGSDTAYSAVWMLPNVLGGSSSVGITVTNGITSPTVGGLILYEVSGLGTPVLDQSSTGSATTGTSVSSGASGDIKQTPEFVIGTSFSLDSLSSLPASPWTSQAIGANAHAAAGYQIANSSGNSYTWSGTGGGSAPWSAGIATVYPPAEPKSSIVPFGFSMSM